MYAIVKTGPRFDNGAAGISCSSSAHDARRETLVPVAS